MSSPQQPEQRSLHRKLTEVMAAVDWQPKTEKNASQGYAFVSVERIKDAVRTELAKRQVMVYTSIKALDRSEFTTSRGSTMLHVTVQGEVTFADGESGEMFTVEAAGEAMDTGDKALNKAQTALVKYALINTFLIPTGDDPDHESPEVAARAQKPVQAAQKPAPPPDRTATVNDGPQLTDDDWAGVVEGQEPLPLNGNGHSGLSARELFANLEAAGMDRRVASDAAKKMYGKDAWKLTDLTDDQRAAVWEEVSA